MHTYVSIRISRTSAAEAGEQKEFRAKRWNIGGMHTPTVPHPCLVLGENKMSSFYRPTSHLEGAPSSRPPRQRVLPLASFPPTLTQLPPSSSSPRRALYVVCIFLDKLGSFRCLGSQHTASTGSATERSRGASSAILNPPPPQSAISQILIFNFDFLNMYISVSCHDFRFFCGFYNSSFSIQNASV